jgi:hypothetical protein
VHVKLGEFGGTLHMRAIPSQAKEVLCVVNL